MAKQQLILVDEDDKFLGRYAIKADCHTGEGLHHRAFTLLIINNQKEVLLQDRKHQLWDHFLDLTNSHPLHLENGSDETTPQAASRCLRREWGIDFPVKKLFTFNYFSQYEGNFCENECCYFLVGKYQGEVHPNPEVAYGYKWMPLDQLLEDINIHPEIYTPWLMRALKEVKKRNLNV